MNLSSKLYKLPDFYKYRIDDRTDKFIELKEKYNKEYDFYKKNKKLELENMNTHSKINK